MDVDGINELNSKKKVVHAWCEIESYVSHITGDDSFDLATEWSRENHGSFIDVKDPFNTKNNELVHVSSSDSKVLFNISIMNYD